MSTDYNFLTRKIESRSGLEVLREPLRLAECCFTSTETVRLIRDGGAQDGHLDFHAAPELSKNLYLSSSLFISQDHRHTPVKREAVSNDHGPSQSPLGLGDLPCGSPSAEL